MLEEEYRTCLCMESMIACVIAQALIMTHKNSTR